MDYRLIKCNEKVLYGACLRENGHLFRYRAYLEGNFLCYVRARAHLRGLMKQEPCAVEMRNAMLRNHKGLVVMLHQIA